jgi:CheY-like chemotaxis protein
MGSTSPERTRPPTILIVEADENLGLMLALALKQEAPMSILLAHNGTEASSLMTLATPNLLILENDLPGTKGLDLYDQFSADERLRDIPTLIIDPDIPTDALPPHFVHISKPFDVLEVLAMIHQLLSSR